MPLQSMSAAQPTSFAINDILKVPSSQLTIDKIRELLVLFCIELASQKRLYDERREDELQAQFRAAKDKEVASYRDNWTTRFAVSLIVGYAIQLAITAAPLFNPHLPHLPRLVGANIPNPEHTSFLETCKTISGLSDGVLKGGEQLKHFWEGSYVKPDQVEANSNASMFKDLRDKYAQQWQQDVRKVDDSYQEFDQIGNTRRQLVQTLFSK